MTDKSIQENLLKAFNGQIPLCVKLAIDDAYNKGYEKGLMNLKGEKP